MPSTYTEEDQQLRHSDDMQDIITAVPPWILRWGITLFFMVLVLIIGLSALIRYPDIIKTSLKIDSPNSPKPVVAKISGKLINLLVKENQQVKAGQPLAFIESTANHNEVLMITWQACRRFKASFRPVSRFQIQHFYRQTMRN